MQYRMGNVGWKFNLCIISVKMYIESSRKKDQKEKILNPYT